ncbi:riboflavin synthase alpha chain [Murinocardiopsis flavida]|uniref:Riboflavin synthase n=1 Tax=Murinocardiopsis flavida TaxID=645275 RepID=A0A2P8DI03_9ACTN|nr:riboflavin synthase [Murinocardiopsis flavida]PSK96843.1 riboflavin synthase alpha chain [Murinocardiopsis flavida]
MFTGIIEELGAVVAITPVGADAGDAARLTVHAPAVSAEVRHGDSVAVNGVCLTVTDAADGDFSADVMRETLHRSALGALTAGAPVNLEQAVRAADRLGGHIVQGHADGTATLLERTPGTAWDEVRISLPAALARYVAEKGSIAVDGVSLTVTDVADAADAADGSFGIGLIPTTLKATTLGTKQVGDPVNLEVDVIAKYVERLTGAPTGAL